MFDLMAEARTIYRQMLGRNPQFIRNISASENLGGARIPANLQNPQQMEAIEVEALPVVTCSSCRHFERDAIGFGQGIGRCHAGQDDNQVKCLWPDAARQCPAFTPRV